MCAWDALIDPHPSKPKNCVCACTTCTIIVHHIAQAQCFPLILRGEAVAARYTCIYISEIDLGDRCEIIVCPSSDLLLSLAAKGTSSEIKLKDCGHVVLP